MKLLEHGDVVTISFTIAELLLFSAAINEICHGIEVFEFETRIGTTKEAAQSVLAELSAILDAAPTAK